YDVGQKEEGGVGVGYFEAVDESSGFTDYSYFEQEEFSNVFGKDPEIDRVYDVENPGWIPQNRAVVAPPELPKPPASEGFDNTAVYMGAFAPNAQTSWTEGWTAYPTH